MKKGYLVALEAATGGLAHVPGRADPLRLMPTLRDGKQERLAWPTERALVRLPLSFRSIH